MRKGVIWAFAMLAAAPALAQQGPPGGGEGGAPPGGGGPGARPPGLPREMKPLKRDQLDKPVADMFRRADANGDGIVTVAELRGVIEAQRDEQIRARFRRIDLDRNGTIDEAEFLAWQRSLGSLAGSEAASGGADQGPIAEVLRPLVKDGMHGEMLAMVIEPLTATVVAAANTNYDGGASLDEIRAYEHARFDRLDGDRDGLLTMQEARPRQPGWGPAAPRPVTMPPVPQ